MKKSKNDYNIKDSGERTVINTGAQRDLRSGKGRFDLIPPEVTRALAIHFEKGAIKYEARNWEKGIPISMYLDSGSRHLNAVIDGKRDENHLIAAIWNLYCAYSTILKIQKKKLSKDLYDLPKKIKLPNPYK